MSKTKRQSNLELLRIICMFMVFILHFIQGTDSLSKATPGSMNYFILNILEALSIIAVNCFVLISGYFLIKFDFKKISKLLLQVKFYALFLPIIMLLLGVSFGTKDILKAIFPIFFRQWWFFNTYLVLYFISPILNLVIEKLNKIQFKRFLITLLIIFSALNSLYPTFNGEGGHGIYNFILMYFIGAYIRMHYVSKLSRYKYLGIYIVSTIVIIVANYAITLVLKGNSVLFFNYDNIIVVISSIAFFNYFIRLEIESKVINYISKLSFGTYLIHTNTVVWIWITGFLSGVNLNSNTLGITCILISIIGFTLCLALEFIRVLVFDKFENKLLNSNMYSNISNKINLFIKL